MSKKITKTDNNSESSDSQIIPQLLPIEKSHHTQLNDIKTNIIKIFKNRGFIKEENVDKYIKKFIADENDDLEYIIVLDNDTNYNTTIKNKKVYIKIFDYKIASANKNSPIGEYISKYHEEYKFIVVENINQKSDKIISHYKTPYEIFKIADLKINIVEHILVPKHTVLTQEEGKAVLQNYNARKKDMPLILSTDPIARYYGMKQDDICKIERPSTMTCTTPFYRIVVKTNILKAKT
jgi:DNA-directed RNA polymerase subunit H (RpoH/RPB5)